MPLNNDIRLLHPSLKAVYEEAKAAYHAAHPAGYRVQLNETHRSLAVQQAYYAQGRKPLVEINRLRVLAGLWEIKAEEAGRKVTFRLPGTSRHASLPAEAFDVVMVDRVTARATWDAAPYVLFAGFVQAAAAKLKTKVSSGAYWKKRDYPHHELTLQ